MSNRMTRKDIERRLDKLCSVAVRYGSIESDMMVRCYTCGKLIPVKQIHNGHFVGRACRTLRWSPENMRPQCNFCNTYLAGNLARYYAHLKRDGIDADKLLAIEDEWKKGNVRPPKIADLKDKYNYWLDKVRDIEKTYSDLVPKSWDVL